MIPEVKVTVCRDPDDNMVIEAALAGSAECQECIVKQLFRYAYGRRETDADGPVLKAATEVFRGSQFRMKTLIMFLAKSLATPAAEGR